MIYEYRKTSYRGADHFSRVLRTYKDVKSVEYPKAGMVVLTGILPEEVDSNGSFTRWAQMYTIAAIQLGEGEYIERVDLPRD
jgi:hypothetical protein